MRARYHPFYRPSLPLQLLLVASLVLNFSSCASRRSKSQQRTPFSIERVASASQMTLAEIAAIPLQFSMPIPEATYGWERARVFFESHTTQSSFVSGRGGAIAISNERSENDPLIFVVERSDLPNALQFSVSCQRGTTNGGVFDPRLADLQCRNLARFIRDGALEGGELLPQRAITGAAAGRLPHALAEPEFFNYRAHAANRPMLFR